MESLLRCLARVNDTLTLSPCMCEIWRVRYTVWAFADRARREKSMIKHAGYQTISLQTFVDFVRGRTVDLPPRPLLLTFDDARSA